MIPYYFILSMAEQWFVASILSYWEPPLLFVYCREDGSVNAWKFKQMFSFFPILALS